MVEDEYELIPISPIRKIEKRVEKIEKAGTSTEMIKELIDVVKTNQQIVDDIVKVNSEMINKVSELTSSVGRMTSKIDEFIGRLEVAEPGETEEKTTTVDNVSKRLDKIEKRLNALILSTISKTKRPIQRRPMTI
jgi:uncharacterized coiled-coil DUF342 family protein